ncbi:MAG: YceI family protein [Ferruginibacter sp.]|nr:YceI family protein [Ferruginibacter sp.]
MRKGLALLLSVLITFVSVGQDIYTPTDAGSKVHFTIKNFAIKTGGDFTGLRGKINFNPAKLSTAGFEVSVDVSTLDTDSEMRDEHLKEDEYFDLAKFPIISLKSTKVTPSSTKGRYYMFADLTIKGTTRPVEFGFSATPNDGGYLFDGEFTIDRLDYKVGDKSISLQNKVVINLKVLAKK